MRKYWAMATVCGSDACAPASTHASSWRPWARFPRRRRRTLHTPSSRRRRMPSSTSTCWR
eukprot:893034-Prymnesium_polylepis.1